MGISNLGIHLLMKKINRKNFSCIFIVFSSIPLVSIPLHSNAQDSGSLKNGIDSGVGLEMVYGGLGGD